MKNLPCVRSFLCCLVAGLGLGVSMVPELRADDRDRVGADAPHQERTAPANEDKFRLPGAQVPVVSVTQSPDDGATNIKIRKSTAGSKSPKTVKTSKDKQAKAKTPAQIKAETPVAVAATPAKPKGVSASDFDDQRVGNNAPHQERSSDPNAHAARLFIWDR